MSHLRTDPNIASPDDFYADLLAAHENLSDEQGEEFNARLILILANHVGDQNVLREALDAAKL